MPEFILGVDYGSRRIGLAVGQTLTRVANPLTTLANNGAFLDELQRLIQEWQISGIVIGYPTTMEGEEQDITRQVKNFTKRIKHHTGLPVHWVDERLTSHEAERQFKDQRAAQLTKAKNKTQIDAMAAQIILQSWLDQTSAP
ncbi:Holliday junction resolvase RuvX [Marinicella meishanensis]|uniref:Holliday junction resolvase RuvX n=1 Tax=Marinicella meishanensis TaxID=2873263 RepID=UPI001CBD40C3|nr:Holliday junction resolvase RuvX [Marinicella sp. NBU2979]